MGVIAYNIDFQDRSLYKSVNIDVLTEIIGSYINPRTEIGLSSEFCFKDDGLHNANHLPKISKGTVRKCRRLPFLALFLRLVSFVPQVKKLYRRMDPSCKLSDIPSIDCVVCSMVA